jgi:hypothetical protein
MSENTLPPALRSFENAQLPETYKAAVAALAACATLDECRTWSDRAAALASFARQRNDPELEKMARLIRARAGRRCGQLLREFEGRGGDRSRKISVQAYDATRPGFTLRYTRSKNVAGNVFAPATRRAAAEAANISPAQQLTAMRLAKIAPEVFEESVEGPNPPTTTRLAQIGKASRRSRSATRTAHTPEAEYAETWRKRSMGLLDDLVRLGKARDGDADGVAAMVFYPETCAICQRSARLLASWTCFARRWKTGNISAARP